MFTCISFIPRFCRGFYRFHPASWDSSEIDKHELSFPLFFDRSFAQVPSKIRSNAFSPRRYIALPALGAHGSPGGKKTVTDSQIEEARKAPPSLSIFAQYPFHPSRLGSASAEWFDRCSTRVRRRYDPPLLNEPVIKNAAREGLDSRVWWKRATNEIEGKRNKKWITKESFFFGYRLNIIWIIKLRNNNLRIFILKKFAETNR